MAAKTTSLIPVNIFHGFFFRLPSEFELHVNAISLKHSVRRTEQIGCRWIHCSCWKKKKKNSCREHVKALLPDNLEGECAVRNKSAVQHVTAWAFVLSKVVTKHCLDRWLSGWWNDAVLHVWQRALASACVKRHFFAVRAQTNRPVCLGEKTNAFMKVPTMHLYACWCLKVTLCTEQSANSRSYSIYQSCVGKLPNSSDLRN